MLCAVVTVVNEITFYLLGDAPSQLLPADLDEVRMNNVNKLQTTGRVGN